MQASTSNSAVDEGVACGPIFDHKYVQVVADELNIQLTSTGQVYLAEQITNLMRHIVYDGFKYTQHARRLRLKAEDIEEALTDRQLRPLIPLGLICNEQPNLIHISNNQGDDLFVKENPELELSEILETPIPKLILEPTIRMHWLVYEGVIPRLPENIAIEEEVRSDEHELKTRATTIALRRETAGAASSSAAGLSFRTVARHVKCKEKVLVQQPAVESLSVEQQLYLKEIVEACVGVDDKRRQDALQSLEQDASVQALLPRLSRLIFDAVRCNVVQRCLSMLIYLVRIIRAIAQNKCVHLDPVLHEMIPSLLSCMVGRRLCLRPESDNHWALRDYSAKTLCIIISGYDKSAPLRGRVHRALKKVFDDKASSYSMIYGTIMALNDISTHLERYEMHERFVDLLNETHESAISSFSNEMKLEANRVHTLLTKVEPVMRRSYHRISDQ